MDSDEWREMARRGVIWWTYSTSDSGCPTDSQDQGSHTCGGWQEDAHTDVVHSVVDALVALGM
jgi:hypothetical protein